MLSKETTRQLGSVIEEAHQKSMTAAEFMATVGRLWLEAMEVQLHKLQIQVEKTCEQISEMEQALRPIQEASEPGPKPTLYEMPCPVKFTLGEEPEKAYPHPPTGEAVLWQEWQGWLSESVEKWMEENHLSSNRPCAALALGISHEVLDMLMDQQYLPHPNIITKLGLYIPGIRGNFNKLKQAAMEYRTSQ